jgi:hypothetical protein
VSFSPTSDRGDFPIRYCALEYSARDDEFLSSNIEKVILIANRQGSGELAMRVHPNWRQITIPADHPYLEAMFHDLAERARMDSDALLKQLSSLSFGPLHTHDAGQTLADRPYLLQLYDQFMEI